MKKGQTITLCASLNFYEHLMGVADELESKGFRVLASKSALAMREKIAQTQQG